jgi:hypothetical protein
MPQKKTYESRIWTDSLDKGLKQRNMDTTFGSWNVGSLYRAGSLVIVSENYQNMLDLVGCRSDGRVVAPNQQNTNFSMEKGMRIMNQIQDFFCA